jgi:hypothetical protein
VERTVCARTICGGVSHAGGAIGGKMKMEQRENRKECDGPVLRCFLLWRAMEGSWRLGDHLRITPCLSGQSEIKLRSSSETKNCLPHYVDLEQQWISTF